MGSITDIEDLLDIDLTEKKLRHGRCEKKRNQYYRFNDYYIVKLTKNKYMIVDNNKQVRKILRKYTFYCSSHYYARRQVSQGGLYFHQLITNYQKGLVNDHLNRNRLDNRRDNIRITTYSMNSRNKKVRSDCKTGISGVRLVKDLKKNRHFYLADSRDIDKKRITKCFSVSIYGEEKAKQLAIAQRDFWKIKFDYKN